MLFNNRELATALWLLVFAVWALRESKIRRSIGGVFRAFWHFKIAASVCLLLLYVTGVVVFLVAIGMWEVDLLKDTIVWFFVGALAMMLRFAGGDNADNIFRKVLADTIKIVVFLEFLVNAYTFPLVVELLLVPLLAFIVMVDAVASMKEQHASVARLARGAQVVAGSLIIGVAVSRAAADFRNLGSLETLRSISLAPLLSVLTSPFIYFMLVMSKYELVFIRLNSGSTKTRVLRRYAKRRIIMYAALRLKRLQYLLRNHVVDLMHIQENSDVDKLLLQVRSARKRAARE